MRPTIEQLLMTRADFQEGIKALYERKPIDKIVLKAVEEFSELSTALLQLVNKKHELSDNTVVLEEIVDCQMHLELLQKFFSDGLKRSYVDQKTDKFVQSKSLQKYLDFSSPLKRTD